MPLEDLSFDSSLEEPAAEEGALELWSLEPDALEPEGLDEELGELELGLDGVGLLELPLLLPDIEPDGEDGEVLLAPLEALPERDAPVELPPVRSQPYRPPTATAIGTIRKTDFFNKLICRLLSRLGWAPETGANNRPAA